MRCISHTLTIVDSSFLTSLLKTIGFDFCVFLSLLLIMSIFILHLKAEAGNLDNYYDCMSRLQL